MMKKLQLRLPSRKSAGIGLLELMLSLAIIAILLIMATRFYTTARRSELANEAVSMVNIIRGEAGAWYYRNDSTSGFVTAAVSGVMPARYRTSDKKGVTLTTPWRVGTVDVSNNGDNTVTITFDGLPNAADAAFLYGRFQESGVTASHDAGSKKVVYTFDASVKS